MRKNRPHRKCGKIEVKYEYTPDAEQSDNLQKVFEMIFSEFTKHDNEQISPLHNS